jgi:hypothetical protein
VLVIKGIGNIQPPVNHHLVSKARSGIDPGNPNAPSESIVKDGSLNSSNLQTVTYFIIPWILSSH